MSPNNKSSDPLQGSAKAMQREIDRLRKALQEKDEELIAKDRELESAHEARKYCVESAMKSSGEVSEIKNARDKELCDQHLQHTQELKLFATENTSLRAKIRDMETTEVMRANELDRIMDQKQKPERYCQQQTNNIDSMSTRLKAAESACQELSNMISRPPNPLKRRAESIDGPDLPNKDVPRHKKPKKAITACTQCFVHGWECDNGAPCENCSIRGKPHGCKRVMCKYYKKDTCSNMNCMFAHEEDGFVKIVPFTRLTKTKSSPSPVELKAKERAAAKNTAKQNEMHELKKSRQKTEYDRMFEQLPRMGKNEKKDSKGDDDIAAV